MWELGTVPQPTYARRFQKCLGFRLHSPKKECIKRQAINKVLPKWMRTSEVDLLNFDLSRATWILCFLGTQAAFTNEPSRETRTSLIGFIHRIWVVSIKGSINKHKQSILQRKVWGKRNVHHTVFFILSISLWSVEGSSFWITSHNSPTTFPLINKKNDFWSFRKEKA